VGFQNGAKADDLLICRWWHRPHRARNLRPPDRGTSTTTPVTDLAMARIRRRKVLGGLIYEYERAA
jgi:putative transposase